MEELQQVKVAVGSRVSGPLTTAFAVLHGGDAARMETAIARRCWQLLHSMQPLVGDMAQLAVDADGGSDEQQATLYSGLLKSYYAQIQRLYPQGLLSSSVESKASSSYMQAVGINTEEGDPSLDATDNASSGGGTSCSGDPEEDHPANSRHRASLPMQDLSGMQLAHELVQQVQEPLSGNRRLVLTFRIWKKMVLWDLILTAKPRANELI